MLIDRSLTSHTGRPSLEDCCHLTLCSAWQAAQLAAHLGQEHKNVNNFKIIGDIDVKI